MKWMKIHDKPRDEYLFAGVFFLFLFLIGVYTEYAFDFDIPFELVSKAKDYEYFLEVMYFNGLASIACFFATKISFPKLEYVLHHQLSKRVELILYVLFSVTVIAVAYYFIVKWQL